MTNGGWMKKTSKAPVNSLLCNVSCPIEKIVIINTLYLEIETKRENKRRKDEDVEDHSKNNGNKQVSKDFAKLSL